MQLHSEDEIRSAVRTRYGAIATQTDTNGCCSTPTLVQIEGITDRAPVTVVPGEQLGYESSDLEKIPEGAELGLGCGNPLGIASLQLGEVVLDLGSGGGIDCFLASEKVGPTGKVIGVDMTPEMISRARGNAAKGSFTGVEFRLGEIEHLPVADSSVDVVISNCVVNLSPDKPQVFREIFRALKPGGRVAIADLIERGEIPDDVRNDLALISCCIGGAMQPSEIESLLRSAGFGEIRVAFNKESKKIIRDILSTVRVEDFVASAFIEGRKPL